MAGLECNKDNKLPPPEKHHRDSSGGVGCSSEQWAVMLDFLCVHTGLGRDTNEMRPETRQRLWAEMASLLNALGPVSWSREEWRRYWQSRVAAARSRASGTAATATGAASSSQGQSAVQVGLLEEDARVLSVVGDEVSLRVSQGQVVQKRREHVHSGSTTPQATPSSSTNPPADKASPQHKPSVTAVNERVNPSAETLASATSASDQEDKRCSSSPKSESLTSPEQPFEEPYEQPADNKGSLEQLKEQKEAKEQKEGSDAQFRSQVLRHLQQVETTAAQLQAVSDRQVRVLHEMGTTLLRILRLLEAESYRPRGED